jgi:S1-C subfamily serine protease
MIKTALPSTVELVMVDTAAPGGPSTSLCAGFFVDSQDYGTRPGLIGTAAHCVEELSVGAPIQVGLYVGNDNTPKLVPARVVAFGDSTNGKDLAFVALDDQSLDRPPLKLWDKLDLGEEVVAIGAPDGYTFSISRGVVSALNRDQIEGQPVLSLDQTDTTINPGNSGGPLLNLWGRVVGVSDLIVSPDAASSGLGFTVPARFVAAALQQYSRTGNLKIGYVQASVGPDKNGAALIVHHATPGGPADAAGLQAGDRIVRVDGVQIDGRDPYDAEIDFLGHVKYMSPGEIVDIAVVRDGAQLELHVTLGGPAPPDRPNWAPLPEPKPDQAPETPKKRVPRPRLKLGAVDL